MGNYSVFSEDGGKKEEEEEFLKSWDIVLI